MNKEFNFKDEVLEDKEIEMGSLYHSATQAKLTCLLGVDERFIVMTKLTLDISQYDLSQYDIKTKDELKPDICLYTNDMDFPDRDIVKMTEMPLLVIEILSPSQGTKELKDKVYAYFEMGVKTCWLVLPDFQLITVYAKPGQFKNFDVQHDTEVVDEVMNIHLPIAKVFRNGKQVSGNEN
jgi:Uma2 family endonuclease